MLKKLVAKVRGTFLIKYTLVNLALIAAINAGQLAVAYLVFKDDFAAMGDLTLQTTMIVGTFAMLLIVFLYVFVLVGRKFVAPLGQVVDGVRAVCDGEIGRKVEIDSPDEFGVLARSYNQMIDLIVYLMTQMQDSSNRLEGAASDILAATEEQASGSAEQAASISQTTATMEELAATYRQIADNANQVVRMAEVSLGSAESGQQAVMNTLESMELPARNGRAQSAEGRTQYTPMAA